MQNKPYSTVYAFADTLKIAALLESQGFKVSIDDAANNIFYAERIFMTEDEEFEAVGKGELPAGIGLCVKYGDSEKSDLYWDKND